MYVSAIGAGWAPVIFNTEEELAFVRAIQKDFNNIPSYWTGGSTDLEINELVEYHDYYSNEEGLPYILSTKRIKQPNYQQPVYHWVIICRGQGSRWWGLTPTTPRPLPLLDPGSRRWGSWLKGLRVVRVRSKGVGV